MNALKPSNITNISLLQQNQHKKSQIGQTVQLQSSGCGSKKNRKFTKERDDAKLCC